MPIGTMYLVDNSLRHRAYEVFKPGQVVRVVVPFHDERTGKNYEAGTITSLHGVSNVGGDSGYATCYRVGYSDSKCCKLWWRFEKMDPEFVEDTRQLVLKTKTLRITKERETPHVSKYPKEDYLRIWRFRKAAAAVWQLDRSPGHTIKRLKKSIAEQQFVKPPAMFLSHVKYPDIQIRINTAKHWALQQLREEIRARRIEVKTPRTDRDSRNFDRVSCCRTSPNYFLNAYCEKFLKIRKVPKTLSRHTGIELEFCAPSDFSNEKLLPFKDRLEVVYDGSIRPQFGDLGKEIRLLTTEDNLEKDVTGVCGVLTSLKSYVNSSCGTHVHLDMRGLPKEQVTKNYVNLVRAQKYLAAMVPEKRRDNSYCKPSRAVDPYRVTDRYRAINSVSLGVHQTIEVRLLHGTLDAQEIINWIKLLWRIVDSEPMKHTCTTLDTFARKIKLPEELKFYMEETIKKNTPVLIDPQYRAEPQGACEEDHEDMECSLCEHAWSVHDGHSCSDGSLGNFGGCNDEPEVIPEEPETEPEIIAGPETVTVESLIMNEMPF